MAIFYFLLVYIIVMNKHIMVMMNMHICSFNTSRCQIITNWFKIYRLMVQILEHAWKQLLETIIHSLQIETWFQ
jgi:hypothetical protein